MPDMDKRKDVSPESPRATIDRFLTSVHTTVMILLPAIGGKCPRLGIGKCNLKYQRGAKAGCHQLLPFSFVFPFFPLRCLIIPLSRCSFGASWDEIFHIHNLDAYSVKD